MFVLGTFLKIVNTKVIFQRMSVLTQRLNPITGQCDWEMQNELYDYHQEIARSAYADMLHDEERNRKYYEALKTAINKMHGRGKKANVLDIGTGTGLLSMMAVKCGADSVVACEGFKPMAQCAKQIIALNGFSDDIKVVNKRSTELTVGKNGDLKERANILVTEVFDTELIGEGALGTFSHAHKELLESDCYVIPNAANVYAQVVESPVAANWNRLKDIFNSDGEKLLSVPNSIRTCHGAAAVHDIQLSQFPHELFNEVFPPQTVLRFDFSGKTTFNFKRSNILTVKSQHDGLAQVVFMWWDLIMDPDNKIVLSCAPYWSHPLVKAGSDLKDVQIPWRDHWMQAVYYLPSEVKVKKDKELYFICCHDEYSLWFNLKKDLKLSNQDYLCSPICDCGVHIAFSRTRIGQLNDSVRTKKYINVLENCVTNDSQVLILSHGFYLGMVASKLGAKEVYYIEENVHIREILHSFIKFNKLSNVHIYEGVDELKKSVNVGNINVVFGEPFFVTTIVPWDSLHFCYLLEHFKDLLPENAVIIPQKVHIKIIAVHFQDLYKIRAPLINCEGFNMKPFDELITNSSQISDSSVEAQPLWEYPGIALSEVTTIATINLKKFFEEDVIENVGTINLQGNENCNGVAVWVDWFLDDSEKNIISTGPTIAPVVGKKITWDMHTRQGVCLLTDNEVRNSLNYSFIFDVIQGQINLKIS
ncbi:protein arginine N-methyltransferase 7 [Agrilus planipennis]|uniref:Protein arginine N-methyltransferase n=1 Tax=Agrilus planipennis TaxID=224129 RepID=A0A1W4WFH9_AGRPL|nr:protein arginine N-methyltransferase 7 [Agrilus planipennis]